MPRKRLAGDAICLCGSGKVYRNCCWDKVFERLEDDDGSIFKAVDLSDDVKDQLDPWRAGFIEEHGREPGPDELIFEEMPHPEHIEHMTVEAMKEAGIDPAFIFAFEQTGLLVSEENQDLISDKDLQAWNQAVQSYRGDADFEDEEPDELEDELEGGLGAELELDELETEERQQAPPEYPIGTVAFYGPDGRQTTKIAVGVIVNADADAFIERWVGTDVLKNKKVKSEMRQFFKKHGVKSVAFTEGNIGCAHEEGEDFPVGEDCPFCPYWKGK